MSTVFGLFPSNQDVCEEFQRIEDAGFAKDNIRLLTSDGTFYKLVGCDPNRIVAKYAVQGALFGIATYGIFFLVAVWCDCNLYPQSYSIAFEIILVVILLGALISVIIGGFTGKAEYERDTHLYTHGINIDKKVIVLQTQGEDEEKAVITIRQIGCLGVRVISTLNESM